MPHRPMTTLGMPARISMANPSGREIQPGQALGEGEGGTEGERAVR